MVNLKTVPLQTFVTKLCRIRAWQLVSYKVDAEAKKFICEVMVNAEKSDSREISFDDAAKLYGWKSFTVDGKTVVAEHFEKLDEPQPDAPLVDKNFGTGKCWMSQPRITTPMNAKVEFTDPADWTVEHSSACRSKFIDESCYTAPIGIDDDEAKDAI